MRLLLELLLLKIEGNDLRFETHDRDITALDSDPNELAEALLDERATGDSTQRTAFVHSSSWRYCEPDCVILTFFSYSDRFTMKAETKWLPLGDLDGGEGRANGHADPQADVAAHAVRHLAFLLETEGADETSGCFTEETLRTLRRIQADLAGVIFKGRS